ncbi:MAG: MATE family efflux transporter [Oscillospiraceae bacterium]|jgi:putative MATE family efflux protein|nr:MATE family efflux transporter [Oscillospiraceae bacterium]
MRKESYDLTQGGIVSKILVVAVPVMGSQLLQMSYNLTDLFWLGRLSSGAVAASGTVGLFMWLSMALLMFGRMGAEIGVSQNTGRGDMESARKFGENAFMIAVALGLIYGAVMFLLRRQLVGFFNLPEKETVRQAEEYLSIVGIGIPFTFATSAIIGSFTGSGNSRAPFIANLVGLGINMLLDPLLIFTADMGVIGAAIATVIAQMFCFLVMAAMSLKSKHRPFAKFSFFTKPDFAVTRQIVKWASPIALESAFFTLMSMLASRLISPFGDDVIAVGRVGSQIESLSWLLAGGYGSALTSYMGQNFGAKKWGRIRRGFNISLLVMGIWGVAVTLFMVFFGGGAFAVFLSGESVRTLGVLYLRILAVCQIPQCFEAVAGAAFRGCGNTAPSSITSIASNVVRVILAYALVGAYGFTGVWVAICVSAFLRGAVTTGLYLAKSRHNPKEDMDCALPRTNI